MTKYKFSIFLFQILIVFHKSDPVVEALLSASHRLNIEASYAKSADSAIELFQNPHTGGHHIIAVDGRCSRFIDAEALGRTIRTTKGNQNSIMVAILKKRYV